MIHYDRQFITRETVHRGFLEKFEDLLNNYYRSERPQTIGLPSAVYCAGELNLSASYFGDLIKKETGKTAQDFIQSKVIDIAKERIFDHTKSVAKLLTAWDLNTHNILPGYLSIGWVNHLMNTGCLIESRVTCKA